MISVMMTILIPKNDEVSIYQGSSPYKTVYLADDVLFSQDNVKLSANQENDDCFSVYTGDNGNHSDELVDDAW